MTPNLEVNLGGLKMKNPVTVASGTFGYGQEYDRYFDISRLGAITTKSLSLEVRSGNKPPRLVETPAGMLNAIGLQNVGIEVYLNDKLPFLREKGATIIANIYGHTPEEYALAAKEAGADGLCLINTLLGMSIDPDTRRPRLQNIVGGLSGPAIRPVALKMVWDAAQAVKIPIIGTGGIGDAHDALQFLMAGATAVSVGSITFRNPLAPVEVLEGLETYLKDRGIARVSDLIGAMQL